MNRLRHRIEEREGIVTFTAVEIADGKTRRKRRGARPELTRVPVPEGTFFYVLRGTKRTDPGTLFRTAARCAPDVLTSLPLPPDAPVRLFVPRLFPLRRAQTALCAILPKTRLPPQKLLVGAFDPDGALCGRTQALLPLSADVRIVTRRPERFDADILCARRLFGAMLTVGQDAALLARCDAVVCPGLHAALRDVPVVLSCVPADGAFSLLPVRLPDGLVSPVPARLPDRFARLCPAQIPHDLFAAALAEKCGVRSPELYACDGVRYAGTAADADAAAAIWRARIPDGGGNGKRGRESHT